MPIPKEEPEIPIAVIAEPMRSWSIETMFTCILRFRSVREEALIVLKRGYFNKPGEGYLAYLFELIERLNPDHKGRRKIPYTAVVNAALDETTPPHAGQAGILGKDEVEMLLGMPSIHHPDVPGQSTWGLLYRSYHEVSDDDVTREHGFALLAQFVKERGHYQPLRAALLHAAPARSSTSPRSTKAAGPSWSGPRRSPRTRSGIWLPETATSSRSRSSRRGSPG